MQRLLHPPAMLYRITIGALVLAVISCSSARAQSGACCVGTSCTLRTLSACNTAGGEWLGGGTSCSGNPCGGATLGACCNNTTFTCTATAAGVCGASSSTFLGLGVSCLPNPCPARAGACCTPATGSCQATLAGGCTGTSHVFIGVGSSCSPSPCPGACCNVGFSDGGCRITPEADCPPGSSATVFQGTGTTCSPNPCVRACCNTADATCSVLGSLACLAFGGVSLNATVACSPDPCAALAGACCDLGRADGGCRLTLSNACPSGSTATVFQGTGTTCSPNPCVRACCHNGDATCSVVGSLACLAAGGVSLNATVACSPDPCAALAGACCDIGRVDGGCRLTLSNACPSGSTATVFQGAGTTCSPNPCVVACCNGGTCSLSGSLACQVAGGTSLGSSTTCSPCNPCVPSGAAGACCRGAVCELELQSCCTGSFRGAMTVCGTTPCCPADFNNSGGVTVQDIFDFLAAYFAGSAGADFNHLGGVTVQDIFDFLAAYFAGCP